MSEFHALPPAPVVRRVADRDGAENALSTPRFDLLRRAMSSLRRRARERQPLVTVSEQVMSEISGVHSVHR